MNPEKQKVTIKDVAQQAGVSTATVSRVINNSGFVSEPLRSRVLRVMEDLGYVPNRIAQSLKKRESFAIAYLLPDIDNPIFAKVVRGIQDVLESVSYDLFLYNTGFSDKRLLHQLVSLLENRPRGVIISAWHSKRVKETILLFRNLGFPVVVVHAPRDVPKVDAIVVDDCKGSYEAVKNLIQFGHRHILSLGVRKSVTSSLRKEGYRQAMMEAFGAVDERFLVEAASFSSHDALRATRNALHALVSFTAVFAHSDSLALGAMEALDEVGLRVPDDVSVVGFDGAYAFCTFPKLTTMVIPNYEMGKMAAELLLERLRGDSTPPTQKLVLPTFLHQSSLREIRL